MAQRDKPSPWQQTRSGFATRMRRRNLKAAPALTAPSDDSLHYLAAVMNRHVESRGEPSALDTNITMMPILDAARQSARTGTTLKLSALPQ